MNDVWLSKHFEAKGALVSGGKRGFPTLGRDVTYYWTSGIAVHEMPFDMWHCFLNTWSVTR